MIKFDYVNRNGLKKLKGLALITSFAFLGMSFSCQKKEIENEMKQDILEMQYDNVDKVKVDVVEKGTEQNLDSDEAMVKLVDSLSILANDDGVYEKIVRGKVHDKDYEEKYQFAQQFVEDNYYDVLEAYLMNMVKGKVATTLGITDINEIKITAEKTTLTGNRICNYVDSKTGLEYPIEILEGFLHGELSKLIGKLLVLQEKEKKQEETGELKDVKKMLELAEEVYQQSYIEKNRQGVLEWTYTKLGGELKSSLEMPGQTRIRRK